MNSQTNQNFSREKPRKKKKNLNTLIILLVLCIPIFYLGVQLYTIYYKPYETRTAIEVTLADVISVKGVVARDETVIADAVLGTSVYTVNDGVRISEGYTVAEIYDGVPQARNKEKIDYLDRQIEDLEYAQDTGVVEGTDIKSITNDLNANYLSLLECISMENYEDLTKSLQNFTSNINRLEITLNKTTDFNALISTLTTERDNLVSTTQPIQVITAPDLGYYISNIDTYEEIYNVENAKNLTTTEILTASELKNQENTNTAGKIINDYKWYYVCVVEKDKADRFLEASKNSKIEINFGNSISQPVPAFIEDVIEEENGEYVKVVLRCEIMRPDLANLRFEEADISFRTITGIRIDKDATHIVDGHLGVYTKFGHMVSFEKIEPIFENDDYLLLPVTNSEDNEVEIFDEIIIDGKDLYDGKLL